MRALIFLVGSDRVSSQEIKRWLEGADFSLRECSAADIVPQILLERPAIVLIDARLGKSAFELCSAIRSSLSGRQTKVVLLLQPTSFAHYPSDFSSHVDDCVFLPVSRQQMVAHVEAILWPRALSLPDSETMQDSILRAGAVELNLLAMRLSVLGETIPTTSLEFRLLEYLVRNPGRVFTRDQLLDAVWGQERFITPRSVDACVRRIRNKIKARGQRASFLKTIRGAGYSLEDQVRSLQPSTALPIPGSP